MEGVSEAQKSVSSFGGQVNPPTFAVTEAGRKMAIGFTSNDEAIHVVEFDVAVTATEGTETKGGIGVVAGIFALGSQGKSENVNAAISRIQFKIPVSFPANNT